MSEHPTTAQLAATFFIDSDHSGIVEFASEAVVGCTTPKAKAIAVYRAVRDGWRYDPYTINLSKDALKASDLLHRDHGYCVEKATLLAAVARAVGIPARLGFAKVKNHLGTSKLETLLRTDLLVFHGYTDLFLEGQWVKATPAFNAALCQRFGVEPLEFDGVNDSIFQENTDTGDQFMEYIHDYGVFDDLPRDLYVSELEKHYPHIFEFDEFIQDGFSFKK